MPATAVAPDIAVACTRKNVPGTKRFAVAAVKAGGAVMHRLGLSETVLVFPEHRAFLGEEMLAEVVDRLRRAAPEKKLLIEVNTLRGGDRRGQRRLRRDPGGEIHAGRNRLVGRANGAHGGGAIVVPVIAAAGGIHAGNVAAYAQAGATSW